ncbi:MAG: PAS domain S-box protein, partial [Gemmatimonadota bacterium]
MIFDITPRVRAREALERAKEKYETVFSVSPVAIAVADQEHDRFVEANRAFEQLFGYGRDELSERELSPGRVW